MTTTKRLSLTYEIQKFANLGEVSKFQDNGCFVLKFSAIYWAEVENTPFLGMNRVKYTLKLYVFTDSLTQGAPKAREKNLAHLSIGRGNIISKHANQHSTAHQLCTKWRRCGVCGSRSAQPNEAVSWRVPTW